MTDPAVAWDPRWYRENHPEFSEIAPVPGSVTAKGMIVHPALTGQRWRWPGGSCGSELARPQFTLSLSLISAPELVQQRPEIGAHGGPPGPLYYKLPSSCSFPVLEATIVHMCVCGHTCVCAYVQMPSHQGVLDSLSASYLDSCLRLPGCCGHVPFFWKYLPTKAVSDPVLLPSFMHKVAWLSCDVPCSGGSSRPFALVLLLSKFL